MSQQINLFNPIFLKQKKIFAAATMVQGLAVILLVCILMSLYAGWQLNTREKQAAISAAQVARIKASLDNATAHYTPHAADPALPGEMERAQDDVNSLQRVQDAMNGGGLGDTKGYSTYFRSFSRQIVEGVWLIGVDINGAGQQIDLKGRALRADLVPEYLKRLGREPEMKAKTFATLDMTVPTIEVAPGTDGKAKPPAPAPYIEFDLESNEADGKEGKGK
ncbi:MAG: PilN domain-containing protein [Burkholderiaceae bacterium]|nr:PilN domain-containing protein [Burkholderiaceae bacterium]